jgi:hypothetical protein
MSPEKSKILTDKYPKIFPPPKEDGSDPPYYFGFDCGDGWFDLIDLLCNNIQHHIEWAISTPEDKREDIQVVAVQIKEKFSTLRFYYDGGDEYLRGMIQMAEAMSGKICENCGDKATVRTKGWIRNLCQPCHIRGNFKAQGFELK